MEVSALCTIIVVLRVLPNRSQFFQYESVSLSCGQQQNWTIKRNTSRNINEDCFNSTGGISVSDCFIDVLYVLDSGVYWCESAAGECSESINIRVTGGPVILESPVHPVVEGEDVTLGCRQKTSSSSSNFMAQFYREGLLIGSSSTGTLTISSVSKSDQGVYMCSVSGAGPSPGSWLVVRGGNPEPVNSSLTHVLLPVVGVSVSLSLGWMLLLCFCCSHEGRTDPSAVWYAAVSSSSYRNETTTQLCTTTIRYRQLSTTSLTPAQDS